jgi:hypothetical protein
MERHTTSPVERISCGHVERILAALHQSPNMARAPQMVPGIGQSQSDPTASANPAEAAVPLALFFS